MSEMIERVAQSIAQCCGVQWGGPRGVDDPDFVLTRTMYCMMARAAIEAMREPTRAMVDAAYDAHDAYEAAPLPKAWCGLSSAYRAMIDAALKDDFQRKAG